VGVNGLQTHSDYHQSRFAAEIAGIKAQPERAPRRGQDGQIVLDDIKFVQLGR
jgi:hypothetical protein